MWQKRSNTGASTGLSLCRVRGPGRVARPDPPGREVPLRNRERTGTGFRSPPPAGRRWKLLAALAAVYLIWGSTYLAIRIVIETIPPFLSAGVRFLVAGGVLLAWSFWKGADRPSGRVWKTNALSGILMFLGGNGAVVWAEQFVPSGLVALLVATVPLWIVLQDWVSGRGGAPSLGLTLGILWGFVGVGLLVTGSEIGLAGPQDLLGGLIVLVGAACWSAGSLVSRYGARAASASLGIGIQMVAGGGALLILGLIRGEVSGADPSGFSSASVLAFFYLVVFGSLIGFTAYIWLLRNTTPAVASTYAYVNPAVALFLGWALVGEPVSPRTGLAAFVILSAVVLITTQRTRGGPPGRNSTGTGDPQPTPSRVVADRN